MVEVKDKKSIGMETKIASMDPKKKKLFMNMITVILLCMIVYAVLTFAMDYMDSGNFMHWFSTANFATSVVVIVLLAFAYKILSGGKLKIPEKQTEQKEFHINNPYGEVQGFGLLKGKQQEQQPPQQPQQKQFHFNNPYEQKQQSSLNIPNYFGQKQQPTVSWKCPHCKNLAFGDRCKCGQWRK